MANRGGVRLGTGVEIGKTRQIVFGLLAIMTRLDDTCVLHRGGPAALSAMHQGAQAVLDAGGSASLAGRRQLLALDRELLAANASPGGAAELLAATLLVDRLEPRLPGDL